ncbi:MAG TPA: hypothetical protein VH700_07040 [Gemmatimonadales bacterium]|jgi:Tfp pilus assembly protein PilV
MSQHPSGSGQQGFTVVEALVGVMLLSVGAMALGAMLLRASRSAIVAATSVQATASLNAEVSRLNAVPFSELTVGTTCQTINEPPAPHTRCTTVNSISSKTHEVIIVITPSGNSLMKPDTVKFRRAKGGGNSALNTP